MTEIQRKFIINSALCILKYQKDNAELECRRIILNFLPSANFTDEEISFIEEEIEKSNKDRIDGLR